MISYSAYLMNLLYTNDMVLNYNNETCNIGKYTIPFELGRIFSYLVFIEKIEDSSSILKFKFDKYQQIGSRLTANFIDEYVQNYSKVYPIYKDLENKYLRINKLKSIIE